MCNIYNLIFICIINFAKFDGKVQHMNEKMFDMCSHPLKPNHFPYIIHSIMNLMGQNSWWVRSETLHRVDENMFCFIAHLVANVEFIISWCKCLREKLLAWPPKNVWCNIKNESLHFTKFLWQAINKQFIINKDNYIMLNLNITVNTYK